MDSLKQELKITTKPTERFDLILIILEEAYKSNPDLADSLPGEAISIARKYKSDTMFARGYLSTAKLEILYDNFDKARTYLRRALLAAKKSNEPVLIAMVYDSYGALEDRVGSYDKAMFYHLKAIAEHEKVGDKKSMANSYKYLGILQARQEKHEEALKYFLKSLDIDEEIKNLYGLGQSYNNVGITYYKLNKKEEAVPYFRKSVHYKTISGNRRGLGGTIINLGEYHNDRHNYDSAMYFLNRCLSLATEVGSSYQRIGALLIRSDTWIGKKNLEMAAADLEEALLLSNQLGLKLEKSQALKKLADVLTKQGRHAQALQHLYAHLALKDTLLNEENSRTLLQLETRYQSEKKENEIRLLNSEKKINALQFEQLNSDHSRQKLISVIAVLVLLVVLVLSFFIYRGLQANRKANALLVEKNHMIEAKNHEILDSINYARHLQEAILPSGTSWKNYFSDSFILYKPKDIVAGDFYFLEAVGDEIIFAVADCTGHGVPGAMVSVVCSSALSRSVKEFGLTDPGKILDQSRKLILETFSTTESEIKDGMDISLCCLNRKKGIVRWAGANNPLWIIHNEKCNIHNNPDPHCALCINNFAFHEVKPDKQPVGVAINEKPFTTHQIRLQPGDALYLLTDGYQDQFGGDKGKKFKASNLKKLIQSVCNHHMEHQGRVIHEYFETWRGNLEQIDDVCIIGARL